MTIYLIQNKSNQPALMVNKDLAGGFGTATYFGNSLGAKLLTKAKGKSIVMPSLTLAYLAAIFKKNNHQVSFTDDYQSIKAPVDLILIISSIVDYRFDLAIAGYLREKFNQANVGFIGTFASVKPEFYQSTADFVIIGEAEGYFLQNPPRESLRGLIRASMVEDLNALPFPDWSIFPYQKFSYFPTLYQKPFLPIMASRGCPYSCFFYCPYPLLSGRICRQRSVENLIAEVKYLINNFKIKSLLFRDPIFTLNRKFVREFAEQLIAQKIKIAWACETRLDLLNEELIDLFYQSGLRAFNVGIESSDPNILKDFKRLPIKEDHQEKIIRYCEKKGINISAFYILGLPTDTPGSIKKTIAYAKKLNTNTAQFTICTPYPGTLFYEEVKDKIYEKDWEKFNAYTPVFTLANLSHDQLLFYKEKAHVSYYFRLIWIWKFLKNYILNKSK